MGSDGAVAFEGAVVAAGAAATLGWAAGADELGAGELGAGELGAACSGLGCAGAGELGAGELGAGAGVFEAEDLGAGVVCARAGMVAPKRLSTTAPRPNARTTTREARGWGASVDRRAELKVGRNITGRPRRSWCRST